MGNGATCWDPFRSMIYAVLFGLGVLGSWLATRGYQAVQQKQALRAAFYDLGAIEAGVISLQVWEVAGFRFGLLQAEALGLALGTWIAVQYTQGGP